MIIAPETEIYLLKAPLEVDEMHQLDFANETAQVNYFQSLPKLALMNATYQRENGTMYVGFNIEQIRTYNYVMYKNKQYSNKWFYAFIIGLEYEGNTTTGVKIKTDVFQTYLFNYQWKRSYIKRETVNDDTFGKHLLTENFDLGDYVLKSMDNETLVSNSASSNSKTPIIVLQCSERLGVCYTNTSYTTEVEDMYIIGGVPQGCWYYMFYNTSTQLDAIRQLKKHLDSIGKGNAILNIFVAPTQVVDTTYCILRLYDGEGNLSNNYCSVYVASGNTYLPKQLFNKTISKPTTFGKGNNIFTPHNNKTLTYPYNYFLVSNNAGNAMPFHYEDFDGEPKFYCIGTLSVSSSFTLIPNNSLKSPDVENGINNEMIIGTPLPSLSWDSDYYLNWIAQNKGYYDLQMKQWGQEYIYNTTSSFVRGVGEGIEAGNIGAGVAIGVASGAGSIIQGAMSGSNLVDKIAEDYKVAKAVPNSVSGNLGAGDLAYSIAGSVGFKFYKYQIRKDVAVKVDRYFDMFGYRVNELKSPNTKSRRYWNFIQTVGANITGDIPQEAISELKAMFNAGLTIWHDPSNFLNYDLTNSIL